MPDTGLWGRHWTLDYHISDTCGAPSVGQEQFRMLETSCTPLLCFGFLHSTSYFLACYDLFTVSSVAQSSPTLCDPMNCSMPGFPVFHYLLEFAQTHVHLINDAIQTSRLLWSSSPPAFHLSHCQGLLRWVSSSHQVAKVLELQLQHQSFWWIFRTALL